MTEQMIAALVSAICWVESSHRENAINIEDGNSASYGLCQIKLGTARLMGFRGGPLELWRNPKVNREYATKYFRYQMGRYGSLDKAIAAYNAGSVRGGVIRNRAYVEKVLRAYKEGR